MTNHSPDPQITRPPDHHQSRLTASLWLVVRRYAAQIRRRPALVIPALLLPGIGTILVFYAPPLVIAKLLAAFARGEQLSSGQLAPFVLTFAALWLAGEVLWRAADCFIARAEIRGMEALYIEALDELLAKDLPFFHNNFAGSLTKRALGYARRFEDVFDVMCLQVAANAIPVAFVVAVLWTYSPALVATLLTMLVATMAMVLPLIRRRARLVDIREAASNTLAGHVADSIANAETVRAFAREGDEADIHARNVGDFGAKTLRSWDYQNLRVNIVTSPMYVATNTLGLVVALAVHSRTAGSLEAVFITFSYYAAITRVVWQFNSIYRSLESALTDAAQFTELLLDQPSVVDASDAPAFAPRHPGVELNDVSFRYAANQPLVLDRFSLTIAP